MKNQKYYLGLDIGTDSVGYAVTDEEYNLLKFHGEPAWGVTLFDAASLSAERRAFRTARRRLDRRQQRVQLTQELFAKEITKVDPQFFVRLQASNLFREDAGEPYALFNDDDFTDKEYYEKYPTIHHLIFDLMTSSEPHDVRLVYLACAWLVAHRGHFLNNINKNNLSEIKDFSALYKSFEEYFIQNDYVLPWTCEDADRIGDVLKKKQTVTAKSKELLALLFPGTKPSKTAEEDFPFSREALVNLLAGRKVELKALYSNDEYSEFGSVALSMDDDKLAEIQANLGDDFELITTARKLYDWAVLSDILGDSECISEAKVKVYDQHKEDLKNLKILIHKYCPENVYKEMFRQVVKRDKNGKDDKSGKEIMINNYVAYAYHTDEPAEKSKKLKKISNDDFGKYVLEVFKTFTPDEKDASLVEDIKNRISLNTFMPKQKNTNNRVIPYQLYWYELKTLLDKAAGYLPFLQEKDSEGRSVQEKALSIITYRIPYFVGPLNRNSEFSWIVRKAEGKIYPWNFEEIVDLDKSEEEFIRKLTNRCTYLPSETVLPKDSLCYHKFMVLNEINNLKINNQRIPVELKQRIYTELFMKRKKVTLKAIRDFLMSENQLGKDDMLDGVDVEIKSNLAPQIAFNRLLASGLLSEQDVERIIERSSYAEDKARVANWLRKKYPSLPESEIKYICSVKIKDFGRLSRAFLCDIIGQVDGEEYSILQAMWETKYNLMELLSDKFTFNEVVKACQEQYYTENKKSLSDRLDDMYVSNAVKRPIYRTLDIVNDVVKAFGKPEKIFVEMARGTSEDQKGKRTKSRREQIMDLYKQCRDEDVRELKAELERMGDAADNRLQSERLFLYYMQLGRSMYSGTPIDLEKLSSDSKIYDIDHIYPQAMVKDDSILNNKVLVLSEENGKKSDAYPVFPEWQKKMFGLWTYYKEVGLITEEKFKRLTRITPFSEDEKWGFINRQLTETSQSTKAVATLLSEKYPKSEVVYVKARLASEFRQEFDCLKSRVFNDLHHAKDAYLNIVVGNVYYTRFTKEWFFKNMDGRYSIKTSTLFSKERVANGKVIWRGEPDIAKVKKVLGKNNAHFTKYAFFKKGGFFDQMPVPANKDLVPLKNGLNTEKYGGYNKAGVMFLIPVRYSVGKKSEVLIMSVEMLYGKRFLEDTAFAKEYAFSRLKYILGKQVDDVSFPMGMRPWKIHTMLSLDGFCVCIAGIGSKGKCLVASPVMQFSASPEWNTYLKRVERFVEKCSQNKNYIYDEKFDCITPEKNLQLYDLYREKMTKSIYRKRINNPSEVLECGRETFIALDVKKQAQALLSIHGVFGRVSGGCDLTLIGGAGKAAATVNFSSTISNWKKQYSDVRIIDRSASGLWETKSAVNLLDLA